MILLISFKDNPTGRQCIINNVRALNSILVGKKIKSNRKKQNWKLGFVFFFTQFLQNLRVEAMLNIELILDNLIQRNKERFYSMKTMPHFNFSTMTKIFIFCKRQVYLFKSSIEMQKRTRKDRIQTINQKFL